MSFLLWYTRLLNGFIRTTPEHPRATPSDHSFVPASNPPPQWDLMMQNVQQMYRKRSYHRLCLSIDKSVLYPHMAPRYLPFCQRPSKHHMFHRIGMPGPPDLNISTRHRVWTGAAKECLKAIDGIADCDSLFTSITTVSACHSVG